VLLVEGRKEVREGRREVSDVNVLEGLVAGGGDGLGRRNTVC